MRKNMARVIGDFMAGRSQIEKSCSTDGQTVYSYSTAIAARTDDGRIILNGTKYSPTTSRQQAAFRGYFTADVTVDNVPRGATRETLLKLAEQQEGAK
jgi:hypothetical protein